MCFANIVLCLDIIVLCFNNTVLCFDKPLLCLVNTVLCLEKYLLCSRNLLLCFKKCLLCLQIKATVIREYITLTRLNYISFLPRTMPDLIKRKILVACKIWSQDFENHPLNRPNPMIITKYYIVDLKEIF